MTGNESSYSGNIDINIDVCNYRIVSISLEKGLSSLKFFSHNP